MNVTLKRSLIKCTKGQLAAAKALGLKTIGQSVEVPQNPAALGQVEKIKFLLEIQQ
jgi:ribosomal protein L30